MSDIPTPRTDAAEIASWSEDGLRSEFIVHADFARELERKIATLKAESDLLRREVCRHRSAAIQGKKPEDIAAQLQWDCFKEETDDGA